MSDETLRVLFTVLPPTIAAIAALIVGIMNAFKAEKIHVLVNSNMSALKNELAFVRNELAVSRRTLEVVAPTLTVPLPVAHVVHVAPTVPSKADVASDLEAVAVISSDLQAISSELKDHVTVIQEKIK